jgi:replication initiation and membrane attachment protein DnaB
MTKAQMLNQIDYQTILKMMLPPDAIKKVQHDVDVFMNGKHKLPVGVLNAILVRTIQSTGDKLFNGAYLRKVTETFKAEKIRTVNTAIEHIERNHDHARALDKKQRTSVGEPDWMDSYIKDLATLQG